LLARGARLAVVAFCKAENNQFLLLPLEDYGKPEFTGAVEESLRQGFAMIALISLRSTADGLPLVENEAMPGVSTDKVQEARKFFCDGLIRDGVLKSYSHI
jgi:hypothetical protein